MSSTKVPAVHITHTHRGRIIGLSPRQKICSRKKGRRKSGKRKEIREKRQATKKGSSYLKKNHIDQEDDHECLRDSINAMEQTSQGTLSPSAYLSARSSGFLCARSASVRQCRHAKGVGNALGIPGRWNQND